MKKSILFIAIITIFCGEMLHGQINQKYLTEYAEKEAYEWGEKLSLSNYKTNKLSEILLAYKVKEGKAVLDHTIIFDESQKLNIKEKQNQLKKLFSSQEYKLYITLSEYSNIDRVEHLKNLIEDYSKNEELVMAIIIYREQNILPVLRVHRGELEMKISNADKEALSILREELYETLDKCTFDCKSNQASSSQQHKSLDEVLFKEMTSQVGDKMSSMNHLLQLAKKYKEAIHEERSHFESNNRKWNSDMEAIYEKYILDNHIETFRKVLESNSVAAWKHIRFDAFFLLLDPSTEEEAKKILKLGMKVFPHLEI